LTFPRKGEEESLESFTLSSSHPRDEFGGGSFWETQGTPSVVSFELLDEPVSR